MYRLSIVFLMWLTPQKPLNAITLRDLPKMVRVQNRDVQTANKDLTAAQYGDQANTGRYFPELHLKNSYTRLNDDLVIDIEKKRIERDVLGGRLTVGIEIDPPPVTIQKKDIYNSHLELVQPLYAGGRITAANKASSAHRDEAESIYLKTIEEKTAEALVRYFQVQAARSAVSILDSISEHLLKIEGLAESLVQAGVSAKFSTLQVKVARAELSARRIDAQSKAELALLALQTTLGLSPAKPIDFEVVLKKVPLTLGLDRFKTEALSKRQEFAVLNAKKTQVDALKDVETGKMLPTMYAFGKYELLPDELTALQPEWAVGVALNIPLSAGITQIPERLRAAELRQKIDIVQQKAQHEIPLQIESIYSACLAADKSILALDEGLGMAEEAARLAEVRFKAGQGSSIEILKAANDLEGVRIKRLQALEDFNRHLIELYLAAGSVGEYIDLYEGKAL